MMLGDEIDDLDNELSLDDELSVTVVMTQISCLMIKHWLDEDDVCGVCEDESDLISTLMVKTMTRLPLLVRTAI